MVDSITPRTSDLFCDNNDEGNFPFAACHQNIQGPRSNVTYHTKEPMCAPKNSFTLIHQNIRGINRKLEELQEFFNSNNLYPHTLCFSEHHLRDEVYSIGIDNYVLGSCFSRSTFQKGGICIYVHNDVSFNYLDLSKYCKKKILEICAVQIVTTNKQTNDYNVYI